MTQQVLTNTDAQDIAKSFNVLIYARSYKGRNYYEHALCVFKKTKNRLTDEHLLSIFEITNYNKYIVTASIVTGTLSEDLALKQLKIHNYDEDLCAHALSSYQTSSFYVSLLHKVKKQSPAKYERLLRTAKEKTVLTPSQILEIEYSCGTITNTSVITETALSFLETIQMSN